MNQGDCRYFEICGLPGWKDQYCMLHSPLRRGKDLDGFNRALDAHLAAGRSDLRYVQFPEGNANPDQLSGRVFAEVVNLQHARYDGTLNLNRGRFEKGLLLGGERVGHINLSDAVVGGLFKLEGTVDENSLSVFRTTFESDVEVKVKGSIHFRAMSARFHGDITVEADTLSSLNLEDAEFERGFALRGVSPEQRIFFGAKFNGALDWQRCQFDVDLDLSAATFSERATLDLEGAVLRAHLIIRGRELPATVDLNGCTIRGETRIIAEFGARRPRIVARAKAPWLENAATSENTATFHNVDLSECLLVGNDFRRMDFLNVQWHRARGRWMLYDERRFRKRGDLPVHNLRETYQVLKERYARMGDHVRSGDFHYGEMEMKRREYRSPWLCPEFLYCAASGYGTRWRRALLVLATIIVVSAVVYYLADSWAYGNLWKALQFSIAVATLQRPEVPKELSLTGEVTHVLEAILGPVQIALFGLALRMRLRR